MGWEEEEGGEKRPWPSLWLYLCLCAKSGLGSAVSLVLIGPLPKWPTSQFLAPHLPPCPALPLPANFQPPASFQPALHQLTSNGRLADATLNCPHCLKAKLGIPKRPNLFAYL